MLTIQHPGTLSVPNDTGFIVGNDPRDAKISVSGNDVLITNPTTDGDIQIRVNDGGHPTVAILDGATAILYLEQIPSGTWRGNKTIC